MKCSPNIRQRITLGLGAIMVFAQFCHGAGLPLDHAKITEVVNSVTVLDPQTRSKTPAETNAVFRVPEIMKTGAASRSEMIAEDQTITRVGANTLFSFEPRERAINLKQGSILFQSPAGMGGGTIRTAAATAAVLGTTIIVVATRDGGFKLLVLEGTGEVRMPNGKHIILHGGQMIYIPPNSPNLGPILDFRLSEVVQTGKLVVGFKKPLPSWDKIQKQIHKQENQITGNPLAPPGTVLLGDVTNPNTRINQVQALHLNPFASTGPTVVSTPLRPAPTPVPAPTPRNPTGGVR
jgi:hypothetical protein